MILRTSLLYTDHNGNTTNKIFEANWTIKLMENMPQSLILTELLLIKKIIHFLNEQEDIRWNIIKTDNEWIIDITFIQSDKKAKLCVCSGIFY